MNDKVKILGVGFICKRMVSVAAVFKHKKNFQVRSELILFEEVLTPCLCSWRFVCKLRFPGGDKVFCYFF